MKKYTIICGLFCMLVSATKATSNLASFAQHDLHALWHFNFMIDCTTNDTFVSSIIDYASYGCYCGFGGKGVPVDGVDRCCLAHDLCYGLAGYNCPFGILVYLMPYKYTLADCETDHASITCQRATDYSWWWPWPNCAEAMCQCDRSAAICFGTNPYHEKYRFYDTRNCKGPPRDQPEHQHPP